jgi:hypothetical protein
MAQGKKIKVGDFCDKGHKIDGDNVHYQKRAKLESFSIRCKICHKAKDAERNARYHRTEAGMEANRRAYLKMRDKSRAERYDQILSTELSGTQGKYTGLNYLKLNKRSQRAWEPLEAKFDQTVSKCYKIPEQYIDYDEDNPPTKQEAYEMCAGCPMLVECARFAAAYKPVIGVWGGERYEAGVVIKTSYR